jgi:hypothetical protein
MKKHLTIYEYLIGRTMRSYRIISWDKKEEVFIVSIVGIKETKAVKRFEISLPRLLATLKDINVKQYNRTMKLYPEYFI